MCSQEHAERCNPRMLKNPVGSNDPNPRPSRGSLVFSGHWSRTPREIPFPDVLFNPRCIEDAFSLCFRAEALLGAQPVRRGGWVGTSIISLIAARVWAHNPIRRGWVGTSPCRASRGRTSAQPHTTRGVGTSVRFLSSRVFRCTAPYDEGPSSPSPFRSRVRTQRTLFFLLYFTCLKLRTSIFRVIPAQAGIQNERYFAGFLVPLLRGIPHNVGGRE